MPFECSWSITARDAFGLAFRLTGNAEDAEEVVQESFLKRLPAARPVRGQVQLRHLAAPHRRQLLDGRAAGTPEPAGQGARQRGGRRGRVAAGRRTAVRSSWPAAPRSSGGSTSSLDELTPQERAAFTLRHREGRSIEEIGRTLGLQRSAAKHAVFRAVKKLRVALEPLRDSQAGTESKRDHALLGRRPRPALLRRRRGAGARRGAPGRLRRVPRPLTTSWRRRCGW